MVRLWSGRDLDAVFQQVIAAHRRRIRVFGIARVPKIGGNRLRLQRLPWTYRLRNGVDAGRVAEYRVAEPLRDHPVVLHIEIRESPYHQQRER